MPKSKSKANLMFTDAVNREIKKNKGLPPVHLWNPPLSGDMDMRIARNGEWFHEGSKIERVALVKLFASILRRDEDGCFYLLTPVEKWRITVEGAPFTAQSLDISKGESGTKNQCLLTFGTNVGDEVTADSEHPIRVEVDSATGEPTPYVLVRGGLEAQLDRNVFYQLADIAQERVVNGEVVLGVESRGTFFRLV